MNILYTENTFPDYLKAAVCDLRWISGKVIGGSTHVGQSKVCACVRACACVTPHVKITVKRNGRTYVEFISPKGEDTENVEQLFV